MNPGESAGYAVFSRRGGVDSTTGATVGPLLMLADVADVRVEASSGEVHLSWTRPRNAIGIRVVRNPDAPPGGPDDGEKVEADGDGAHDLGLEDDRSYHYGIYAVYRGARRPPPPSRGAFAAAIPHPAVVPVPGLFLAPDPDGSLRISWERPAAGASAS